MSTNSKTYDFGRFILDSVVPEIDVPVMKPNKRKSFKIKQWLNNAVTKISNQIEQKSVQIAEWILNAKIEK